MEICAANADVHPGRTAAKQNITPSNSLARAHIVLVDEAAIKRCRTDSGQK
jgi:hypothetical protein